MQHFIQIICHLRNPITTEKSRKVLYLMTCCLTDTRDICPALLGAQQCSSPSFLCKSSPGTLKGLCAYGTHYASHTLHNVSSSSSLSVGTQLLQPPWGMETPQSDGKRNYHPQSLHHNKNMLKKLPSKWSCPTAFQPLTLIPP